MDARIVDWRENQSPADSAQKWLRNAKYCNSTIIKSDISNMGLPIPKIFLPIYTIQIKNACRKRKKYPIPYEMGEIGAS